MRPDQPDYRDALERVADDADVTDARDHGGRTERRTGRLLRSRRRDLARRRADPGRRRRRRAAPRRRAARSAFVSNNSSMPVGEVAAKLERVRRRRPSPTTCSPARWPRPTLLVAVAARRAPGSSRAPGPACVEALDRRGLRRRSTTARPTRSSSASTATSTTTGSTAPSRRGARRGPLRRHQPRRHLPDPGRADPGRRRRSSPRSRPPPGARPRSRASPSAPDRRRSSASASAPPAWWWATGRPPTARWPTALGLAVRARALGRHRRGRAARARSRSRIRRRRSSAPTSAPSHRASSPRWRPRNLGSRAVAPSDLRTRRLQRGVSCAAVTVRRRLDAELVRRGLLASSPPGGGAPIGAGRVRVAGMPGHHARPAGSSAGEPIHVARRPARGSCRAAARSSPAALERFACRRRRPRGPSTPARRPAGSPTACSRRGAAHVVRGRRRPRPARLGAPQRPAGHRARAHQRARASSPRDLGGPVDVAVADLSFISLRDRRARARSRARTADADFVLLVKPQFEAGPRPRRQGRHRARPRGAPRPCSREVARRPRRRTGSFVTDVMASPLRGADGNVEFLVRCRPRAAPRSTDAALARRRPQERA